MIGQTLDGNLYIVSVTEFTSFARFRRENANNVEEWVRDNVIPFEAMVLPGYQHC